MFNKFKNGEIVIATGVGKSNDKNYNKEKVTIINRDPFFLDYNIKLQNGEEDWIDGKFLKKLEKEKKSK